MTVWSAIFGGLVIAYVVAVAVARLRPASRELGREPNAYELARLHRGPGYVGVVTIAMLLVEGVVRPGPRGVSTSRCCR